MSEPDSAFARLRETWTRAPAALRRGWPWLIVGGALLGFLMVFALRPGSTEGEGEASTATHALDGRGEPAPPEEGEGPAESPPPGEAPVQPPLDPKASAVDAGPPLSPNVKLTFRTFPPRRASVHWGSKRLGFIDRGRPLVVERARDSGPLDVIVRSPGFLPVHARAYTFEDSVIDVKITPIEKKDTIYGYQQPLGDAGVPEVTGL